MDSDRETHDGAWVPGSLKRPTNNSNLVARGCKTQIITT